ncbi:MAG: ABC transporter ATP-binding protein [Planctomycetia bacterium]|nr:ABC transporter ATP-binding protein [Planctomycetia bacterium]
MNFYRVLKVSFRYKWSILFSILSALGVGVMWGANLSAVYPFMEITFKGQTLQAWIDQTIAESESEIENFCRQEEMCRGGELPAEEVAEGLTLAEIQRRRLVEQTTLEWYRFVQKGIYRFVPDDAFQTIALLLVGLLLMTLVKIAFLVANTLFITRVTNLTIYDLRNQLFDKCLQLDMARYNNDGSAQMMSRITNDVGGVSAGISNLYGKMIREPLKMLVCVSMAIWINWQLFVMTALLLPPIAWIIQKLAKKIKKTSLQIMREVAMLFQKLQEAFYGIKVIKCFTMEDHFRNLFHQQGMILYKKSYKVAFLDILAKGVVEFSGILIVSIALLVGAWLVLSGGTHLFGIQMSQRPLSIEWLVMFYVALLGAADPARKLSDIFTSMQNAFASADRVYELLDEKTEVVEPQHPVPLTATSPDLVFRHVDFDYQSDRPVLRDVNLTVPFGKTIGIVGANGSGKSTLLHLIPRLADPTAGEILLGGVPLKEISLRELHAQMGVVSQDAILFNDTVMNNIRFGRFDATDDEVVEAAKQAFAHEFIETLLPQGYQTSLGPHGNLLSGGQRQRIALARVILRNPKILLLDEATSQIDLESERSIQEALAKFHRDRTMILVTHRLSILDLADEIVVMESGRITDRGTHEELLKRSPFYARLHQGG